MGGEDSRKAAVGELVTLFAVGEEVTRLAVGDDDREFKDDVVGSNVGYGVDPEESAAVGESDMPSTDGAVDIKLVVGRKVAVVGDTVWLTCDDDGGNIGGRVLDGGYVGDAIGSACGAGEDAWGWAAVGESVNSSTVGAMDTEFVVGGREPLSVGDDGGDTGDGAMVGESVTPPIVGAIEITLVVGAFVPICAGNEVGSLCGAGGDTGGDVTVGDSVVIGLKVMLFTVGANVSALVGVAVSSSIGAGVNVGASDSVLKDRRDGKKVISKVGDSDWSFSVGELVWLRTVVGE